MERYNVYIPFVTSYEGEIADEDFSVRVKANSETEAIKQAVEELHREYFVKNLDSSKIEVEKLPEFDSFDEWEEIYTALKNPKNEGDTGLTEIMFDTHGDEYQTVRGYNENHIWTIRDTEYGLLITSGLGMVDRFGYIISEQPVREEDKNKAFSMD